MPVRQTMPLPLDRQAIPAMHGARERYVPHRMVTRDESASRETRVEQIAQMVEETSTAMQATANTASEMNKIAGDLSQLVSRFRC